MKHEWYAWGPYLAKFKVENKLIKELNKRAKTLTRDARFTLAGHLDNENCYEDKDKEWFMETFKPYFQSYLEESVKRQSLAKPINKVKLIDLWINFMKRYEYNPPHFHDGDLSFVIYTKVPQKLIDEKYIGTSGKPGSIIFQFGEQGSRVGGYITQRTFMPEEGDMFIFPAGLYHHVTPYKTNVERISVSGNIDIE